MSNLERRPEETPCGGRTTATLEPARQVLEPREVPLGGTRAMVVRRTLPHRALPSLGAWCFLDDYGPADIAGTNGMQVPPHPHTGLQTVTWLLEGEVFHQDSVGSQLLVRPGELNLMTAGHGIAHAETSPADHSDVIRGVQLWVALPDAHRHGSPHFEHHADLPVFTDGALQATVLIGAIDGASSPATAYSPLLGAEVRLAGADTSRLPLEPSFEHAALALTPGLEVDAAPADPGALVYLGRGRHDLRISAGPDGGRLLVLGGEPFEEELLMWWNFVGRSHDEIVEAREQWESARSAGGGRFGTVAGYAGPALPAPPMPAVRLRPRQRG